MSGARGRSGGAEEAGSAGAGAVGGEEAGGGAVGAGRARWSGPHPWLVAVGAERAFLAGVVASLTRSKGDSGRVESDGTLLGACSSGEGMSLRLLAHEVGAGAAGSDDDMSVSSEEHEYSGEDSDDTEEVDNDDDDDEEE